MHRCSVTCLPLTLCTSAQADLGVSVGAGTDVAMEAADIVGFCCSYGLWHPSRGPAQVLVKSDLRDVITALHLSDKVFRRIQYNFVFALGYNVLGSTSSTCAF